MVKQKPHVSATSGASEAQSVVLIGEHAVHTQGLQLPAHDWAPIRTVPVRIPRDHERTFEAFDRTKHLSSTVESGDEAAEMLPFAVSPLELPRYLASRPEDKEAIATIDGEEVSFKLDTLQTDLLAAYPVLLPFHLVRGKVRLVTVLILTVRSNGSPFQRRHCTTASKKVLLIDK